MARLSDGESSKPITIINFVLRTGYWNLGYFVIRREGASEG